MSCMHLLVWNYSTLFGVETPTFDKVHSILADHSFNLDVNALVGKVHTILAKRKTISAESVQFRKMPNRVLQKVSELPVAVPWSSVIQTAL